HQIARQFRATRLPLSQNQRECQSRSKSSVQTAWTPPDKRKVQNKLERKLSAYPVNAPGLTGFCIPLTQLPRKAEQKEHSYRLRSSVLTLRFGFITQFRHPLFRRGLVFLLPAENSQILVEWALGFRGSRNNRFRALLAELNFISPAQTQFAADFHRDRNLALTCNSALESHRYYLQM